MTFDSIVTEIAERAGITSAEGLARIGRAVNSYYKRVTSSIGLQPSRRVLVQANATLGSRYLTFTGIEKVLAVQDRSTGSIRVLDQVVPEEIDDQSIGDGLPTRFAVYRANAGSVQIYLNVTPQTEFTLYCEGYDRADTLSGGDEPAFPESFHDLLVEGALADELRRQEKPDLAKEAAAVHERRVSDLRMFLATSAYQDIHQGKRRGASAGGSTAGSGGASGSTSYTQTGLITFDRTGATLGSRYPFAVAAGSEAVENLNADLLDGQHGSYYTNASNLASGTVPVARISGLTNTQIDNAAAIDWSKISKAGSSLADLTTRSASNLSSGTLPDARFPATLPAASGANLTALNATNLASGTVPGARLDGNTFKAADGAVGTPGFAFNSDPDTGAYRGGANILNFATAGAKALGINPQGQIDSPTQFRCSAKHSTTQSIANATWTNVQFDTDVFDVGAMHDPVTNNSRFTIPTGGDGVYLIAASVFFAGNATGTRYMRFMKGGGSTDIGGGVIAAAVNTDGTMLNSSTIVSLAAGEFIEAYAYQSSGGNLNIGQVGTYQVNQLQIVRLW